MDSHKKTMLKETLGSVGINPKFSGFDGNNESEYMGIASFIVNQLERYEEFKGRSFNCHYPSLDTHNRMLNIFEDLKKKGHSYPMTLENLQLVLSEAIHPDHR